MERKDLYLEELIEFLELPQTNELINTYFDVIWEFTSEFKFDTINYCNNKIRGFLESLTIKSDIYYLVGKKLNWSFLYEEFDKLNSLLIRISGNPEEISGKYGQFNIVEEKKSDRDFIFYIEDYDLLEKIFLFYLEKQRSS